MSVKKLSGTSFKITITQARELRVKVPTSATYEEVAQWVERCHLILDALKGFPVQTTLRGKTLNPTKRVTLYTDKRKNAVYKVFADNSIEVVE